MMLKNDFFELPKVKWLHLTGDADKFVRCSFKFSQDMTTKKLLKSVNS